MSLPTRSTYNYELRAIYILLFADCHYFGLEIYIFPQLLLDVDARGVIHTRIVNDLLELFIIHRSISPSCARASFMALWELAR